MDARKEFADLAASGCVVEPVGSRVTCDPPPVGTDEDYLVVVPNDNVSSIVSVLVEHGYAWEGQHSEHYQNTAATDFMSWRKDATNFIVTASEEFANRWRAATHVCKRINLLDKADRIALFQAVLYGNKWEPPHG